MSWRTLVDEAYGGGREGARARYETPAYDGAVVQVERGLTCTLPQELRELFLEADGIMELIDVDGGWIENMWIFWPLEQLRERNIELRRERGDGRFPSGALAFSGAGADGVLFAFDLRTHSSEVFAWDPIDARLVVKARCLREFLPGWVAGKISV
jgi:hypothetical protein